MRKFRISKYRSRESKAWIVQISGGFTGLTDFFGAIVSPSIASGIVVASGNALPLNCGLNNIRMVIGEHQKANEKNAHHNA